MFPTRTLRLVCLLALVGGALPVTQAARADEEPAAAPPVVHTLSLKDAIDEALSTSPGIQQVHVQSERARLQKLRAELEHVHASVDVQIQEVGNATNLLGPTPPGVIAGVLGLSSATANVEVPLFSGFRVEAGIDKTTLLLDAANADVQREQLATATATARAYASVRRVGVLCDAQLGLLKQIEEVQRLTSSRVHAGLAPAVDEQRALSRALELQDELLSLQAQREQSAAELAVLLGRSDVPTLSEPMDGVSSVASLDDVLAKALRLRPESRAASKRVDAAAADVVIAQSSFYPQLSAFGLAQYGNNNALVGQGSRSVVDSFNPFAGLAGDVQLGLSLSMNLFDTWQTTYRVDDARHQQRIAIAERAIAARSVEADVRRVHAQLAGLLARRALSRKSRDVADANLATLKASYSRGDARLSDVLDAALDAARAARTVVDIDAQATAASWELRLVMGLRPEEIESEGSSR
jgi:outer membrane protein